MIASHYAEPLPRVVASSVALRSAPAAGADVLSELQPGDSFEMLDNSLGWAWGYGGANRLVGYVESATLKPA